MSSHDPKYLSLRTNKIVTAGGQAYVEFDSYEYYDLHSLGWVITDAYFGNITQRRYVIMTQPKTLPVNSDG